MEDQSVSATELSILYTLQGERVPLSVGAIADRANARDHQVVTLLGRLCREDLAYRVPVHTADWPPSGLYRLTSAGRRWVARVVVENRDAVEPEGVDAPPRRSTALSRPMREAVAGATSGGEVVGWSRAVQDALIRRGLASPLFRLRFNPATNVTSPHRIGVQLNERGMVERERVRTTTEVDAQRPVV
jgi:hypothetical protein